jgi:AcrR family transcriptional regulator
VSISDVDEYFKAVLVTIEPLTPERRRAMTREHLLEAAAVVFARNGYHGASLDEVAAAAGFTKGAVYSNFKSKEDLFLALLDHRIETMTAAFSAELDAPAESGDDQLRRIQALIARGFDWDQGALHFEFMAYAARNPETRAKLAASARRGRDATVRLITEEHERLGTVPAYPIPVLAQMMLSLFDGLASLWFLDPELVDNDMLREVLAFLYANVDRPASPDPSAESTGDR